MIAPHLSWPAALLWLILGVAVAPAVRAESTPADKPPRHAGRTEISEEPWTPPPPVIRPQVIYGSDDRIDVYEEQDPLRQRLARATCGLFSSSRVVNNGDGTYTLSLSSWRYSNLPPCSGEPFAGQPVGAFCTGFLVGPDLIATAGHCYDASDLSATRFVFGFQMLDGQTPVRKVDASQVYRGIQIVGRQETSTIDYAVIRLDRPVTAPGALPLPIRRSGTVPIGTRVGAIGHPAGLPLKLAFGAQTEVKRNSHTGYFEANLDTYGGNSGSPVFNADTGVVEGILVRGAPDYVVRSNCFESNRLSDSEGTEDVSKTTTFVQFIPPLSPSLRFLADVYGCQQTLEIELYRPEGADAAQVIVTSLRGDAEELTLTPAGDPRYLIGTLLLVPIDNTIEPGNGRLETWHLDEVSVATLDGELSDTALIDCMPFDRVAVQAIETGIHHLTLDFRTSDSASIVAEIFAEGSSERKTLLGETKVKQRQITVSGLEPCTLYTVEIISLTDLAGNLYQPPPRDRVFHFRTKVPGPHTLFEPFDSGAAAGWTHASTAGPDRWMARQHAFAVSQPYVFSYLPAAAEVTDARLVSPVVEHATEVMTFWHTYEFEEGYDGGVIEISTNGGASWTDLGPYIVEGGYDGVISTSYNSPIGGRGAWTGGALGAMRHVRIDLSSFPPPFQIRLRFTTDVSVVPDGGGGWLIDDVQINEAVVCSQSGSSGWTSYH
ncbi:MAG TPA: trypsin-like peptidase domain-containing protein [Candidatus Sumerlaeota bacterium]|nr:trypsin-like peptidase domain-containing protein [Candidatus Sumerlaeota bacterium]HPK03054.1 trypsin-like peptidase domain-containing protein [Candidatus Sumerlaeota bacterium]